MTSVWGSPIPDKLAFQYWKCSDCPWTCDLLARYPRNPQGREAEALARFKKHSCVEYNAAARGTLSALRGPQLASTDQAGRIKTLESEVCARALWLELYENRPIHREKEIVAYCSHSEQYEQIIKEIHHLANPK